MKKIFVVLIGLGFLICFSSGVFASSVSVWQGQYYTGTTFNVGTYIFNFSVYDSSSGGSICFTNTTSLTTGNWGEWRTEQSPWASCNNASKDYFLNINIAGSDMTPRRRLTVGDFLRRDVPDIQSGNLEVADNISASYFLGDGSYLTGVAGSGDINSVQGDGVYLYNGSDVGGVVLAFNESRLNVTIDVRTSGLGDNASWNESYADTKYILGISEGSLDVNSSTWWASVSSWVSGWFYSNSGVLTFNESKLNDSIDARSSFSEVDPYWSSNSSLYNSSWSSTYNSTYNSYNSTGLIQNWNSTGYIRNWSTSSYVETDPYWSGNFSLYNSSWSTTYNSTYNTYNSTGLIQNWNSTGYIRNWSTSSYAETDPYWSGNFSLYNSSWSTTYNLTYDGYNSTGLIKDWNATGYIKNWSTSSYVETDPYWSGNFSLYNSSWSSTYNSTYDGYNSTGLIKDWNATGYIKNWSTSSYVETDPYWSGNFSLYNSSWSSTYNSTYDGYNSTGLIQNWNSTGYIRNWSTSSYVETDPYWSGNFSLYNSSWSSTYNSTYNSYNSTGLIQNWNSTGYIRNWSTSSYVETDPYWSGNSSLYNSSWSSTYNSTYNSYNSTGLIQNWNSTGYIRNWSTSSYVETDPYWSGNFSLYNSSWSSTYNLTYDGYNSTGLIKDWNATGYIKNWSTSSYVETDPYWSGNSSLYNSSWSSTYNSTYNAYNSTGLIQDWNSTGYIKNWSTSSYTETDPYWSGNFSLYNSSWSSTYNSTYNAWAYNQTIPAINRILGFNYYNSTDFDFNNYLNLSTLLSFNYYNSTDFSIMDYYLNSNPFGFYNSTTLPVSSEIDPYWSGNMTNVAFTNVEETFDGNITVEGIKFENDVTNHRIYDNASCVIIKGDTSTMYIC